MLRRSLPVLAALATLLSFNACSDDETSPTGTGNTADGGGAGSDSSTTGGDSGGTASKAVNGCTSYTDGTTIAWERSMKPPASCVRVKKGGTVTFNGDFASHPLAAKGGDGAGTPFTTITDSGNSQAFTFATVGTFGFVCNIHPDMTGAIEVVP